MNYTDSNPPECKQCKTNSKMIWHGTEWICHGTHALDVATTDDQLKQRDAVSDTPRTERVWKHAMENYPARLPEGIANFARILERELAAVTAERDALNEEKERLERICRNLEKCVAEGLTKDEAERLRADLSASQQEAQRLREELAKIRDHGKGNSVWAASRESQMADAALASTPAPVQK